MKSYDKVNEAYFGSMGESFAKKTRERIHWICSRVQGEYVLDVGCSQGIVEFLLAREGKNVVGIDIEKSVIDYAKNELQKESESVRKRIQFFNISIFDFVTDKLFDTVILGEVLEHFSKPGPLLERVTGMLKENGTMIITVPFGINNYHDHKKTYYLFNLIDDITPYVQVKEVVFFGKWVGLVTVKECQHQSINYPALVKMLESAFYSLEQYWMNKVEEKTRKLEELETMFGEGNDYIKNSQNKILNELTQIKQKLENIYEEYKNLKTAYDNEIKKNLQLEKLIEDYKGQIEKKNKLLLERLDSEEKTLEELKESILRYNELEAKYQHIKKKFELLRNAKLGRLTINYWKFRKRIPKEW